MSINHVSLSGNLTRDAELRATASGTQVLSFGLAVNERRKNTRTGEWEDYANFVDCTMFGARAEALERYLSKGTKVALSGKLSYSSWERDGERRSKLEVIIADIEFLSPRETSASAQTQAQQPLPSPQPLPVQQPQPPSTAMPMPAPMQNVVNQAFKQTAPVNVYDEDIPF
ncbi:single-stranded DNA-binding protein [Collinsella sp. zg1085]|uniref:single-stranded DNA-binding protein n=1 Tax=Collinsella sp. zg1085 TaxID=2844380 RepID=UPI001C0C26DD|nr:single-stranded DNA-binding protein [Collinsella sp. zg1085]QWT18113.1 single-stranded DNA-binding protein [Collinsella sp. zg1085]